jgi:hypothetical protein
MSCLRHASGRPFPSPPQEGSHQADMLQPGISSSGLGSAGISKPVLLPAPRDFGVGRVMSVMRRTLQLKRDWSPWPEFGSARARLVSPAQASLPRSWPTLELRIPNAAAQTRIRRLLHFQVSL